MQCCTEQYSFARQQKTYAVCECAFQAEPGKTRFDLPFPQRCDNGPVSWFDHVGSGFSLSHNLTRTKKSQQERTTTNNKTMMPQPETNLLMSSIHTEDRLQPQLSKSSSSFLDNGEKWFAPTRVSSSFHAKVPALIDELGPYDILCGRSGTSFNNVGNRRFRVTISINLQRYIDAPSRQDKGKVIKSVVRMLKDEVGARFLKKTKNGYVEMGEKKMREKVGHALRDMAVQLEGGTPVSHLYAKKTKKANGDHGGSYKETESKNPTVSCAVLDTSFRRKSVEEPYPFDSPADSAAKGKGASTGGCC